MGMCGKGTIDLLGTIDGREGNDTGMIDQTIGGIGTGMRGERETIARETVMMSVSANPVVTASITVIDETGIEMTGIEMTGIVNQREGG